MSIKIGYITTARSDYGPAYWLLHDLFADRRFETHLIVGGSHLAESRGMTVREIEGDGWPISAKIPFLNEVAGDNAHGDGAARALAEYCRLFTQRNFDLVVLYGDRYELLPIATAAVISQSPMAHLCGGDVTGGAIDEQVRHAVTKMAHLHLPSTAQSAARIVQMGEDPWRVHNVGDPALDHFVRGDRASAEELAPTLGFMPNRETLLVTFHPVTLELEDMPRQTQELVSALKKYSGSVVITAPAPDPGSEVIGLALEELARKRPRTCFVQSLGSRRYRGLLHLVGAMLGNSSSGLTEAACVPLPVINIGSRQQGRERSANVIDVPPSKETILKGIETARSREFEKTLAHLERPYGDGNSAQRIVDIFSDLPPRKKLMRKEFCAIMPGTATR